MDFGITNKLGGCYPEGQYSNNVATNTNSSISFAEFVEIKGNANTSKVDAYTGYLKSKYGNAQIQSVGKDQHSFDKIGKSMSGNDVVIAPNILEQMTNDPKKQLIMREK